MNYPDIYFSNETYPDYISIINNQNNRIFLTIQVWDYVEFSIVIKIRPERNIFFNKKGILTKSISFSIDEEACSRLEIGLSYELPLEVFISHQEIDKFPFQLIVWSEISGNRSSYNSYCSVSIKNTQQPIA